jgi:cytochrome c
MRKPRLFMPGLLLLLVLPMAEAQERGARLVEEKVCFGCHQMTTASIGPPWQAIAARHAARKEVMVDVLASRIMHGGGGNWGLVPMVPNQRVNQEEARVLAAWVLQQTPQ